MLHCQFLPLHGIGEFASFEVHARQGVEVGGELVVGQFASALCNPENLVGFALEAARIPSGCSFPCEVVESLWAVVPGMFNLLGKLCLLSQSGELEKNKILNRGELFRRSAVSLTLERC